MSERERDILLIFLCGLNLFLLIVHVFEIF
jgi:hypothetical protein